MNGCQAPVPPDRDLLLATANPAGTYYPVGVAIAALVRRQLGIEQQLYLSAITSSGSAENIALLQGKEVHLAFIQGLFGAMAWQGAGYYQGRSVRNLRALTALWPNVEQVVVSTDSSEEWTARDLTRIKGRGFSIGQSWSGSEIAARTVLSAIGFRPEIDFRIVNLGFGPSAEALQNGKIEGFFLGAGVPTGAITQVFATLGSDHLTAVDFSDEEVRQIRESYPIWDRYLIPKGTYPGQERDWFTVAQPNLLVTTDGADAEIVYQIVKCLYENMASLNRTHAATRSMVLERALDNLPLPLHPGAIRFYREMQLRIPEEFIPPELSSPPVMVMKHHAVR